MPKYYRHKNNFKLNLNLPFLQTCVSISAVLKMYFIMELKEFIDFICPEHSRTSCSDENISNGFHLDEDDETISTKYYQRCTRCALLEVENGTIKRTEANNKIIPERLDF